jgi:regulator of sigma D
MGIRFKTFLTESDKINEHMRSGTDLSDVIVSTITTSILFEKELNSIKSGIESKEKNVVKIYNSVESVTNKALDYYHREHSVQIDENLRTLVNKKLTKLVLEKE